MTNERANLPTLMIVDDERSICDVLEVTFRNDGYRVDTATSGEEAEKKLQSRLYDIIISDIKMPTVSGLDLLRYAREVSPDSYFILITGVPTLESAIEAVHYGAYRYVIKGPRLTEEVQQAVQQAVDTIRLKREAVTLRREIRRLTGLDHIVSQSPKMRAVFEVIQTVAATPSTVLISGESGTGKELVARAIHQNSTRSDKPFVSINCGAFPETLLESELFGYMRGAFTDAKQNKLGLFQSAEGGTLFLDEIGEMSLSMQVKLLRVLQDRKVRPLGSTDEVPVDVRIIAATNHDLSELVAEKKFREDLYYRISVIPIQLPPLRDRNEDIPLLARHFLLRFLDQMHKDKPRNIQPEALQRLEDYPWPGNVRELENTIERAVALEAGDEITLGVLPDKIREQDESPSAGNGEGNEVFLPQEGIDLPAHMRELEREYLVAALDRAGGIGTRAAQLLNITYRSFRHYAKKYGL
jgi:DNA-binding NtrC family response regulator